MEHWINALLIVSTEQYNNMREQGPFLKLVFTNCSSIVVLSPF